MKSRWTRLDPTDPLLPRVPACYVIYLFGWPCYVGQTNNLRYRMSAHGFRCSHDGSVVTPWGEYPEVMMKVHFGDRYGDWLMREARLIRRLQPQFNSNNK